MRMRLKYLPFDAVQPGMALGEPLVLAVKDIVRFTLPAGHTLTEDNLRQMAIHKAEFVGIAFPDGRTDEDVARDAAAAAARVLQIFEGADLSSPAMLALFDRILAFRSA